VKGDRTMHLNTFIEEKELRIISFTLCLVQEIEKRIQNKVFFYKEQIERYIEKEVELFLKSISAKHALKNLYKYQILSNVHFKLKDLVNNRVFLSFI
jgi:hypothetical protein